MVAALISDDFWNLIAPLLPPTRSKPRGGRPRIPDRACLRGVVFVLRTGIPWEMLPKELGCGSGMTCWRRLRDWQQAGVWDLIHFALLDGSPATPRSIGPEQSWTVVHSERFLGAADRTESN